MLQLSNKNNLPTRNGKEPCVDYLLFGSGFRFENSPQTFPVIQEHFKYESLLLKFKSLKN